MSDPTATIRDIHGGVHDAELITLHNRSWAVPVAGFGHVVIGRLPNGDWAAVLAQGRGRGEHDRDVKVVDGVLEVEVLPNSSGEDRIVVCVHGLQDQA